MTGELGRFLIVGFTTVGIDLSVYAALLALGAPAAAGKLAGFVAGTIFAFFANKTWTFKAQAGGRQFALFIALYLLSLGANVSVNQIVIELLSGWPYALHAAFIMATGVTATINFLGMKFFVFNAHRAPEPSTP
jgi:polyisoprenyl-phosphate glycosyltransferase